MKELLKSVISIVRNNWAAKLLSLIIAIVFWLLVVQYINPEDTRRLENIPIQVTMEGSVPEGEGLVLVTDYNQTLDITYEASRDVIAVLNTDKIIAYVDLTSATNSGEYRFPVKIDTGSQAINITAQSIKEATLKFEKSTTAQVPVNVAVEGTVPDGYVKNDPICVPSVINIVGPESVVATIAYAEVNISADNLTQTTVYNSEYVFVDVDGNTVDNKYITADSEKIDVSISIFKTKTLPVTATIVNSSGGYDNSYALLEFFPKSITVAGSEEVLETLNTYDLGTIDVADRESSFKQEYVVSLQNGVKNVDGVSTVSVNVDFGDIRTKTFEFTNFNFENLVDSQSAEIVEKSISVTLRGIAEDIEKLKASELKVIVDFQNKEQTKGASSFPVYISIPETYKVGVAGKYYLTVNIS